MALTHEQVTQLLRPINERRVGHRDGMSHLEAYDVRAHLNRILGFGNWSGDVLDMTMLYEVAGEKSKDGRTWRTFSTGYRCTYRLTVHATGATWTETAAGDATNFPENKRADAHDFAIKTAESQALKRCAINLGDQFGLSLYNQGSVAPLVGRTLAMPAEPEQPARQEEDVPVDEHVTSLAPETPAPLGATGRPPGDPSAGQDHDRVEELRRLALAATTKSALVKLLMETGRRGIGGAMTTDAHGQGVLLETLINKRLSEVAA